MISKHARGKGRMEFCAQEEHYCAFQNVLGVPGLYVLLNCFTEEAEKGLFGTFGELPTPKVDGSGRDARTGEFHGSSDTFPKNFFKIINMLQDTDQFPGYTTPDYGLSWAYPPGTSFQHHFDSRYQWGETVVGVSLGAPCEIQFKYSAPKSSVTQALRRVWLPRRSVYIMSGKSRFEWTHGVFRVGKASLSGSDLAAPPAWNPNNWRRSWTFRSTKVYQLEDLKRRLKGLNFGSPEHRALSERLAAQMVHYPPKKQNYEAVCTVSDLQAMVYAANATLDNVDKLPGRFSRFKSREALFLHLSPPNKALADIYMASDVENEAMIQKPYADGTSHSGFSISGFGGSSGEGRVEKNIGGHTESSFFLSTSGVLPQGYGLGHLGSRELKGRLLESAAAASHSKKMKGTGGPNASSLFLSSYLSRSIKSSDNDSLVAAADKPNPERPGERWGQKRPRNDSDVEIL